MTTLRFGAATRAGAVAAMVIGSVTNTAGAQGEPPDPFADYDGWAEGGQAPSAPPTPAEARTAPARPNAESGPVMRLEKGGFSVGGRALFSYTGASNELIDGSSESNTTLFMRAAPTVSYFLLDRLQLGASLGWMGRALACESGGRATENDWVAEATAHYFLPLSSRFALAPGAGLGFYVGASDRSLLVVENGKLTETTETTSTAGVVAALYLNAAYQLGQNWQLRSGLAMNALLGSEKISSKNQSLGTSTLHVGIPIELFYTFE